MYSNVMKSRNFSRGLAFLLKANNFPHLGCPTLLLFIFAILMTKKKEDREWGGRETGNEKERKRGREGRKKEGREGARETERERKREKGEGEREE